MISKKTIDEIFNTCNIEEVIQDFVVLKKSGQNYKGLSPFSNEKTPSFIVSPTKQIFKDFSTGKGGNAISFLMEHEHFTYPEALRYVAKKYNIPIDEKEQTTEELALKNEKESLFIVNKFAQKYFTKTLYENFEGKSIGLSYLKERGFTKEIIDKFELGYCPNNWSNFTDEAIKQGYNLKYLEKTGLTIVKGDKKFDRFKGRVMFPIQSLANRVLGFGGRILNNTDKKSAKYLNSPESEIYHKSKILYGISQAKQSIVKNDNCYLVEGYTDVISMHQTGVENVVASSGTALTPEQIRLVKRLSNNITVLYDGDRAGISASFRGIDLILEQGMDIKVVLFPDGEDPDSFAQNKTNEEFIQYLNENATDFVRFKVDVLSQEAKNDPIKKAQLIRDVVQSISKIPDNIKRDVYIKECSTLLGVDTDLLIKEISIIDYKTQQAEQKKQFKQPLQVSKKQIPKDTSNTVEKDLIKLLVNYPNQKIKISDEEEFEDENGIIQWRNISYKTTVYKEICDRISEDNMSFSSPIFQKIFDFVSQKNDKNKTVEILDFSQNQDIDIAKTSSEMMFIEYTIHDWKSKDILVSSIEENIDKNVYDSILRFKDEKIKEMILRLNISKMEKSELPNQEKSDLNEKLSELRRKINKKLNRVVL